MFALLVMGIYFVCKPKIDRDDVVAYLAASRAMPAPGRVAVVTWSPKIHRGYAQHTLPAIADWCNLHGYTFIVGEQPGFAELMDFEIARKYAKDYDFIIVMSDNNVILRSSMHVNQIMHELAECEMDLAAYEHCYNSYVCGNVAAAIKQRNPEVVHRVAWSTDFVIINTRTHGVDQRLEHIANRGWIPEGTGVMPIHYNLVGRATQWNTVLPGVLAMTVTRSDQAMEYAQQNDGKSRFMSYDDVLAGFLERRQDVLENSLETRVRSTKSA